MTGPVAKPVEGFKDLNRRELAVITPLLALILALGFVPSLLTNYINPAISQTPGVTQTAPAQSAAANQSNGSGQ
jgi:NADH-quinone oxidoreductase subunit M